MPFDVRDFAGAPAEDRAAGRRNRLAVACWLFVVAGMILVMIVLGGITRLTGSGLSIMEWAPVSGVLPPLNEADWQRLYHLYEQIPQYALMNHGFGLAGFKQIFWIEWVHRLWGRLIGVAFLVPLLWFWISGRLERRLRPWLASLFVLGGLQGLVGWIMVASGFEPETTSVSPYRLVIHLVLALALYCAVLLTGLAVLGHSSSRARPMAALRPLAWTCAVLTSVTIIAGGLVAGTHAGFAYNTFPLMEGQLIPADYARLQPFLSNLTDNIAAVQFDHRLLATLTALAATAVVAVGLARRQSGYLRFSLLALAVTVIVQYGLGVATLLLVVPVGLAALHQANAVLLLTSTLLVLDANRLPPRNAAT
jgi:heme a synthase